MNPRTRRLKRKRRPFRRVWRIYQHAVEAAVWCQYIPNNIKFSRIADACEERLRGSGLPVLERGTALGPWT